MAHRELDGARFRAWLHRAHEEISRSIERLNQENLYPVADGDTGSNIEATIRAALSATESEKLATVAEVANAAAVGALRGAQGNSGVLLSQILRGFADGLTEDLPTAFALAHQYALRAVSDPREGTILTVAHAASQGAAHVKVTDGAASEIALAAWRSARAAALDSAENPPSESTRGTIDAGAHGAEIFYRALVLVLDGAGNEIADLPILKTTTLDKSETSETSDRSGAQLPSPIIDGNFEVMYELSNIEHGVIESLRATLSKIGESLLIVGDSDFWKVHIHTDFPDQSVDFGREVGEPKNIRITSLTGKSCPSNRILITIANGSGFVELMEQSGVAVIKAFDSRRVAPEEWVQSARDAQEVILIPHDIHGYQSAMKAAEILGMNGTKAVVIKSRSPLQALAAISTHSENPVKDLSSEVLMMEAAATDTFSITIATALRDMESNGVTVKRGSVIALYDRQVISHGVDIVSVAYQALTKQIGSASRLITLVSGNDVDESVIGALTERLSTDFPQLEVISYFGGQAWYPLLIGIE
jgi:DAK2 domain fusion protein YloV